MKRTIGRLRAWSMALMALLVSGCGEEGPSTIVNFIRGPITWDTFVDAGRDGPILVELHGNPFSGPVEDLAGVVLTEMSKAVQHRPTRFTLYPEEARRPETRVLLVFGAYKGLDGGELCLGQSPRLEPEVDRIAIRAVFCSKRTLLADLRGWVKGVSDVGDKRFATLIWQLTNEMFQRH